jgi:hypothetical protein
MKAYAWILCIFSAFGALGCLGFMADGDPSAVYGVAYALAVAVFAGKYIADSK